MMAVKDSQIGNSCPKTSKPSPQLESYLLERLLKKRKLILWLRSFLPNKDSFCFEEDR